MSGPENDLSNTLSRKADEFARRGGADLDLSQVVSRAGEIRRGRRMRASMAMAAVVLAVAVPVGITVISNDPIKPPNLGPAATATPDGRDVELGRYPNGSAPRTGYVDNGTLLYNGDERPLGGTVSYLKRMNGGFLIGQSDTSGNLTAHFLSDQGNGSGETRSLAGGFAVSPQGLFGAFVETDGTVIVVDSGGTFTEIGSLPNRQDVGYTAVAVSDSACSTAESCSVWVVDNGETSTAWEVTPETGPVKSPLSGLIAIDASGNMVRRLSYDDERGATSAYLDINGNQVWTSSEYAPRSFSPDGKHLIAGPAYGDGYADLQLTILDSSTGVPVLDLKSARSSDNGAPSVLEVVWEDNDHVLAVVAEGTTFAVLRVSLDGNREYAVPRTQGEDAFDVSPFKLA